MGDQPDSGTSDEKPRGYIKRIKDVFAVIVVVLLALFLFWFFGTQTGQSSERTRRASCETNLRQLGLAFAMYADLSDGRWPVDGPNPTLLGSLCLLSNVITSARILSCPSDWRSGHRSDRDFDALTISNISYSYVPNLRWSPVNSDSIVALDRINATAKGSRWPRDGNHQGAGGNVLFTDGRVQFCTELPSTLKDQDGKEIVLSP